jgi:hypothetical protein
MTFAFVAALIFGCSVEETNNSLMRRSDSSDVVTTSIGHDFGSVDQGALLEIMFELENPLEEPVYVDGVKSGCGCTTAKLTTNVIEPRGSLHVAISLDTSHMDGPQDRSVIVYWHKIGSEARSRSTELVMTGYVRTRLRIEPPILDFGEVKLGQVYESQVKVISEVYTGWAIDKVETEDPRLVVTKSGGEGVSQALLVRLTPRPEYLDQQIVVRFHLRDHVNSIYSYPIKFQHSWPITVSPESIIETGDGPFQIEVTVKANDSATVPEFTPQVHFADAKITNVIDTLTGGKQFSVIVPNIGFKTLATGHLELQWADSDKYFRKVIPIAVTSTPRPPIGVGG